MTSTIEKVAGFSHLLKTKPVKRTKRLQLFISPRKNDLKCCLGILVPKKLVKRAVDRHQIKRFVREAVRQNHVMLGHDVLVRITCVVKSVPDGEKKQWWLEIHQLLSAL